MHSFYATQQSKHKVILEVFMSVCICEALKFMGIKALNVESVLGVLGRPVLVGGGSDGATVNVADGGLEGMMQCFLP